MILGDRTKYIGGSDIGAIMGISEFTSRAEMLMIKLGRLEKPISDFQQAIFDFGHEAEQELIERFEFGQNAKITGQQKTYQKPIRGAETELILQCHVDGIAGFETTPKTNYLFEAKTTSPARYEKLSTPQSDLTNSETTKTMGIPKSYYAQIQFNMYLANRSKAILHFGERLGNAGKFELGNDTYYIVNYDMRYTQKILHEVAKFVIELENLRSTDAILPITGALPGVSKHDIVEIRDILQELKSLQEKKKEFETGLLEKMKEHNVKSFETEYFKISYIAPTMRAGGFDLKGIEEEDNELFIQMDLYRKPDNVVKESIRIKLK